MYPSNQLDPGSCPFLVSTIHSFVVLLIDLSCWLRSSHLLRSQFSFFFPIQSLRNLFFFLIPNMYDQPVRILPGSREILEKSTYIYHVIKIFVDLRSRAVTLLLCILSRRSKLCFAGSTQNVERLRYHSADDGSYKIYRPGMQIKRFYTLRRALHIYYVGIRLTESH